MVASRTIPKPGLIAASMLAHSALARVGGVSIVLLLLWLAVVWAVAVP